MSELDPSGVQEQINAARGVATEAQKHSDLNRILINVTLVIGVTVVVSLIFTLGGIMQTYLANKQATYQDLRDQVREQSDKIDSLVSKIDSLVRVLGL